MPRIYRTKDVSETLRTRSIVDERGCWIWQGARNPKGYGILRTTTLGGGKRNVMTHRASFMVHRGPIPDGMLVLHECDNPSCVNPDHLRVGTANDNTQDMIAKGRAKLVTRAKVSPEQVREIRTMRERGMMTKDIGERFGVSGSTVTNICNRDTWRSI